MGGTCGCFRAPREWPREAPPRCTAAAAVSFGGGAVGGGMRRGVFTRSVCLVRRGRRRAQVAEAGVDMFVAGSAIFRDPRTEADYKVTIDGMREQLAEAKALVAA